MYKIVFDSDGLIKLTKSGILEKILDISKCIISQEVYNEVVEKGKEKLYEDAYTVDGFIHSGKLKIIKTDIRDSERSISIGELSALELYKKEKASFIVSDDRRFLSLLEKENIPFIIPVDLISILAKSKKINKIEAINSLKKIRRLVREDVYLSAIQYLGGG